MRNRRFLNRLELVERRHSVFRGCPFMQDLLKQAEAKGADARKQLHYQLITGGQLPI